MADMAVRSVLLSEIQSVLSIARRRYGYTLVHHGKSDQEESHGGIFQSFSLLRARLLRCEDLVELNPSSVLRPFLDLIRHEHTSSTLTGAALEAVQHFLQCWDWQVNQASVPDMLADIVDAVGQCRFQETNAESDQHVLVLVVHVLMAVLMCPAADKLSDHAMWQLVEALYALSRANRNDPHITLSLRASATSVLNRAIEFIFKSSSVYSDPSIPASSASVSTDASFGLPCAVKIMGFLCQKLQPRGTTTIGSTHSLGPSSALLPTRREVLLSFMLLQRVLVSCDAHQFAHTPSLMLFIKDDLCGSILRYGRLGASSDLKIPVLCLSIMRLLWTKLRPMLKMQLEALFNGVFCHTLHWTIAHLDLAHPIFPNNLDSVPAPSPSSQGGYESSSFVYVDAVREEFTGEIVPLNKLFSISFEILDCLVDILAEPTLLPDLYVNYDCDGNRSDLTYTLFELLSRVITQTHHACQETSDEVHFLWARAVGELALRGLFNALYVVYSRSQHIKTLSSEESTHQEDSQKAEVLHTKRQRKKLFQHGIQEFNRKPLSGIKYLQQNNFLPTPLDPKSLAAFLRSLPPGLNKVAVGMYLGAMGKEVKDFEKSEIHEADTIEFHREVLEHFVRSFNFESESIVAALRMFLASFRLPGEAQQIDRILNTFSIQVYEQCRDRFLMASADVAYLLSFSLIMLNTDLHNPNIRPEKKMKLEDFIKNNRNYGEEVSKNQDLPNDFMTELYDAIAKEEIKTREDDSKHGEVTTDRWKDLLYQAENDPTSSRLVVHRSVSNLTSSSRAPQHNGSQSSSPRRHTSREDSPRRRDFKNRRVKSASSLRSASFGDEEVNENKHDGMHSHYHFDTGHQYDRDIFALMLAPLKGAFASVFQQFVDVANGPNGGLSNISSSSFDANSNNLPEDIYLPDKGMLQLACNGFVLCAATASSHNLRDDFNQLFIAVTKFSGLYISDVYPVAYNGQVNGVSMYCHNQSAPVATAAMFKIVGTNGRSIQRDGWRHFFHAISALREFKALPDRLLYGPLTSSDSLLTADESVDLLELVRINREELERREAMRLKDASRTQSSSGFFSGVAWLMSALDSSSSGAVPYTPSPSGSRNVQLPMNGDIDRAALTPPEMAFDARDLLTKMDVTATKQNVHLANGFGTNGWILQTLQPYHVERLIDVLSALPASAVSEIVQALHDELAEALTGSPTSPSSTRRPSASPNAPSSAQTYMATHRETPGIRQLSPAGCVLFEHILSRLLASIPRDSVSQCVDGLLNSLELHYLKLPVLVRPILLKNAVVNGVGYDCAAYMLAKAIEGLLCLVLKDRSEKTLGLLMSMLTVLVDMSTEDEDLLRPYLTLIFSGLKRVADSIDLRSVRFERGEWLTVSNLIGWAIEQPQASVHAFAFLEKLIASEVWLAEVETTFSLMELYTKTLLFALQSEADTTTESAHMRWPRRRPMELLSQLFDQLHESDIEIEEEERLRQLGGMVLLCRHALKSSNPGDGEAISNQVNEMAIFSLESLRTMIFSQRNRDLLTGGAWLEVLGSGLLTMSSELLNRKSRLKETNRRRLSSEDGGAAGPFLFFEKSVPPSLALKSTSHDSRDATGKERGASSRRRRASIVKDPLVLRPHILVVEMVSWIACEQLDQLLLLPRFAAVWDELLDQLLAFIELTTPGQRSTHGVANEEMLAALERRSIMSAHEEIVEHVKSIIRRLTVLLHSHEKQSKSGAGLVSGQDSGALAGARFHALMHVLVEKCQSKGAAFYDQLFPSQEETSSTGERTPPLEEEDLAKSEERSEAGDSAEKPADQDSDTVAIEAESAVDTATEEHTHGDTIDASVLENVQMSTTE